MNDVAIFKGNSLVNADLLKSLLDKNRKMAGGSGETGKRISIRGGKFRMIVDGEQVAVNRNPDLNMVILNASSVSRTYFAGEYDPENPSSPMCWSSDTQIPAPEVPAANRQSDSCATCPMNVKGSGNNDSRACRFSQRLAVALENDLQEVYRLQLPATSIFGEAKGGNMGLQAYIKHLTANEAPAIALLTKMSFDEDSATPKLYFSAVRALDEDELAEALEVYEGEDALKAIDMTVASPAQADGSAKAKAKPAPEPEEDEGEEEVAPKPKARAKAKAKPAPEPEEDEGEDGDEEGEVAADAEPKRVAKAKPAAKSTADKLASVIDGWDD